jgi:hypothetical protein
MLELEQVDILNQYEAPIDARAAADVLDQMQPDDVRPHSYQKVNSA